VKRFFSKHGFQIFSNASTLYQEPGKVTELEQAMVGLDEQAGFVVIAGSIPATG
jgi:hypothetical protein